MRFFITVSALTILAGIPSPAIGQLQTEDLRRITLVQTESARLPARAMVYRRASGTDRDVVALSPDATAEDLSRALRVLDVLYVTLGDTITRDVAAAARLEQAPIQQSVASRERGILHASFVRQLRRSATRRVDGFGTVRALDIRVPRARKAQADSRAPALQSKP